MLNLWTISFSVFCALLLFRWLWGRARSKEQREVDEIIKQIDNDISNLKRNVLERSVRGASYRDKHPK